LVWTRIADIRPACRPRVARRPANDP